MSVRVLVPTGALGLAYDADALERGLAAKPDIIVVDGGSTDSGPHYLGTGTSKYARRSIQAEWAALMEARERVGVPLVIGSAGTCGADSAVDWMVEITREIAAETGARVRVAVLHSGQDAVELEHARQAGRIMPLDPAPPLGPDTFGECTNIVALAGAEQIQAALATGADIVIAGRTTDTASIAALPLARGCHQGAAWHGAKIAECGAFCTDDPGSGVVMVEFDNEGFTVTPMGERTRATPRTVSAHMLYENADPFVLLEPGGHLDVTDARYQALNDHSVRVTGSRWVPGDRYTVKLEGARRVGFQTVSLVLVRHSRYVDLIAEWSADVEARCRRRAVERLGLSSEDFSLELRLIGANATLGDLEMRKAAGPEIGVLGIVTARSQTLATEIAKLLNPLLLHHPLPGDEADPTFAFPFSPPEMERGATYEFCLNHVLVLNGHMDAFRLKVLEISR